MNNQDDAVKPISDLESRESKANTAPAKIGSRAGLFLRVFAIGLLLGVVFVKSEVATWHRIHKMFLFQEAHLYLIIGLGVAVAMTGMWIIKSLHIKSLEGHPIVYKPKPFNPGVILGGTLFGAGWAITGACPGPIYAQIGGGEIYALATFAGAMAGMYAFACLKPKLP